jgi:hypothetical protein
MNALGALKQAIVGHGHECLAMQEAGWPGKRNGELLDLREPAFDALVTIDTNLEYRQNLTGRKIAAVAIAERSNRLSVLEQHFTACANAIDRIKPGQFVRLVSSQPSRKEDK